MSLPIEDYALIGDTHTAALVARSGSIDWLCLPRFDSGACFAALLGTPENGRWLVAPVGEVRRTSRRYRGDSLILETEFETGDGVVRLVDGMPRRLDGHPALTRIVEGVRGSVAMRMELVLRFDYGHDVPWVHRLADGALTAIAGPDAVCLRTEVPTHGQDLTTAAAFRVSAGERAVFSLTWFPSHEPPPPARDAPRDLERAGADWQAWADQCGQGGEWREAVVRSLLTLKALTYAPTGGIVAAPTTSLPEQLGGVRNWDYRYCWVRDATLTLYALVHGGYQDEAVAWRDWLLRAVAGTPDRLQILYGLAGERRILEYPLPWLPGYADSSPVRLGNAAVDQFQLDVYGELMDAMDVARRRGLQPDPTAWSLQRRLMAHLESVWREPDEGIWEVRGPRRNFTHSKVMAWVAFDRAIRAVEQTPLEGPIDRWKRARAELHREICEQGYNAELGSFVQYYGGATLDASLLMIPLVGFLPPDDPRVRGTIEAIRKGLAVDGFILRYAPDGSSHVDGLPPGEGAFLPCTFWLADALTLQGRRAEAREIFERLLAIRNDVGLLSEEYDPSGRRMLGNFPQAFSHVGLVNAALNLTMPEGPARNRSQGDGEQAGRASGSRREANRRRSAQPTEAGKPD